MTVPSPRRILSLSRPSRDLFDAQAPPTHQVSRSRAARQRSFHSSMLSEPPFVMELDSIKSKQERSDILFGPSFSTHSQRWDEPLSHHALPMKNVSKHKPVEIGFAKLPPPQTPYDGRFHQPPALPPRPTPPPLQHPILIDVAPGVKSPLRGSNETWEAIRADFYMPALCLGCQATIFCIQDAGFVICPTCKTVSPMDDIIDKETAGVGLGFTYKDLVRWQAEIHGER